MQDTAIRELREETGLIVPELFQFLPSLKYQHPTYGTVRCSWFTGPMPKKQKPALLDAGYRSWTFMSQEQLIRAQSDGNGFLEGTLEAVAELSKLIVLSPSHQLSRWNHYRHFKFVNDRQSEYVITGYERDANTLATRVQYLRLGPVGGSWSRPAYEFASYTQHPDGTEVLRYSPVTANL